MAKTRKTKHVAVAVPIGVPHLELHARGIMRYAATHGGWILAVSPKSLVIPLSSLRHWSGDGIIARINTAAEARLVTELRIPTVNISGALEHAGVPRVTVDNHAVGRLAAEHLVERGFRHFGYYGVRNLWYSRVRGEGFHERIELAGGVCSDLLASNTLGKTVNWTEVDQSLRKWLQSLNSPVAVFACSDYRARMILDACGRIGLNVPDDVAVLGINNDVFACELCDPPMSSVSAQLELVGYETAALLDRLMAGKAAGDRHPDSARRRDQRRSTDVVAIDDDEVATAVRYMRDHLAEPISMDDVAHNQGISRRWLQNAFRKAVGRSPHRYLNFLRSRRARQLLVDDPNMALSAVARACGFSDAKRLRAAFTRVVDVGPSEYRQLHARNESHR